MNLDRLLDRLRRRGTAWVAMPAHTVFHDAPLNDHEQQRASRFRSASDRTAFVAGRMLIRGALSDWMNQQTIPLEIDASGKPYCPLPEAPQFNLSHAAGWVALALSTIAPVGIDLEDTRRQLDPHKLAARYFTPTEQQVLQSGTPETFFEIWTRKEAYLKATGQGLRLPLNHLDTLSLSHTEFKHFKPTPFLLAAIAIIRI